MNKKYEISEAFVREIISVLEVERFNIDYEEDIEMLDEMIESLNELKEVK